MLSILHTHSAKQLQRNLCNTPRPVHAHTQLILLKPYHCNWRTATCCVHTVSKEVCFSVFLYRKGITGIFNVENHDKDSTAKADVELSALSQVSSVSWCRLKPSSWISSCYLKKLSGAAERQCVPSSVLLQPTCLPRHALGVPQPRSCAPKHQHPFSFQPPPQSFLQPPHP